MKKKTLIACFLLIEILCTTASSQSTGDYLVLQNIGQYRLSQPEKLIPGFQPIGGPQSYDSAGVVAGTDHFVADHTDKSYEVMYFGGDSYASPTVLATHHNDPNESLKWLRHEIDSSFRDYLGMPSSSYTPRQVNGQTILVNSVGGRSYRWLSGNKLIAISYRGSLRTLPEPMEVVQAYLVKHPSTLSTINLAQLRSTENKTTWIKDEMERRLWLSDKWFMQFQLKKAEENEIYQESVKSMMVFLDYREKYYGLKAVDEKNLLAKYLSTNNGTGIKAKLTEYKNWWSVNKGKAISL